jgi:DNA-binding MarR family transcriptional regulator
MRRRVEPRRRASPRRPASRGAAAGLALSVWLRLLKVHGLLLREVRRVVPAALTLPQFDVLAQLHCRPEGMSPGELTRALLVTAGNVTGVVERLTRLGLALRQPVPTDRRTVRVRLTRRGRLLMERAIPRHARDLDRLLSGVPAGELAALQERLGALARRLEARS